MSNKGENTMDIIDYKKLLPKGIRFRGNNALQVQSNKTATVDGKKKVYREFSTVPIKLDQHGDYASAFQSAIQEAMKIKMHQDSMVASSGYGKNKVRKSFGVGTLKECFDALFEKQWAGQKQEKNIKIYAQDMFNYFPVDIRLVDMQTEQHYEGFIEFVHKQIEDRPMNNLSSVSNKSINHRLMLIREICRYAIRHGLLDQTKLLNTDIRSKSMGWDNLSLEPSKKKRPLTEEQILQVYEQAVADGELEFADQFIWLCDTGMRHKTEHDRFTVGDINFKEGNIIFFREKTKSWSVPIPLSERCLEIAKARKELAFKRGGKKGRIFSMGYSRRRTLFDRYKKQCNLPEDFKPYATRHTFITRLVEAGNPANVVMDLAGHTCIETTLGFYAQSSDNSLKKAIASIGTQQTIVDSSNFLDSQSTMIGHNSRNLLKVKGE
jgi:integrase